MNDIKNLNLNDKTHFFWMSPLQFDLALDFFPEIINGNLPAHAIWRDEECVSFLSINPISNGHCLVVPIDEIDHWVDLPSEKVGHLLEVASIIGQSQMRAFNPNRIGQMIAGFEVPHTHTYMYCP